MIDKLSPEELERISILVEECGEVIQAAMKILRHGFESTWDDGESNRVTLTKEMGDLLFAFELLMYQGDVKRKEIAQAVANKQKRIVRYLHCHENVVAAEDLRMVILHKDKNP